MLRIRQGQDNSCPRPARCHAWWHAWCQPCAAAALVFCPSPACAQTSQAQRNAPLAYLDLPQAPSPAPHDPAAPLAGNPPQSRSAPIAKIPGSIEGIVGNAQGVPIAGAHISLSAGGHTASQETTSDDAGHFRFTRVPPGGFTVMITLQGFDTTSASGDLQPGQSDQLSPFVLPLSTVNVTVEAVLSTEDLGVEQVRAEEQQRLFAIFPNFFVSYNWIAPPLTTRQKFALATKNASDPGNLLLVGTVAGVQQATNAFPGYSQGAKGYGRRYGADLGNLVVGTYMGGAILPALFHQDPRYFYKGTGSRRSRFWYAVSTAVICRGDNGRRQPAFAGVLGDLSAGAISNLYYAREDRKGAALTFENGLLGIAGDAMNNVFQEFLLRKLTKEEKKQ